VNRGYVKLWRKAEDGGMLANHQLLAFWCWCLMRASHKTTKTVVGFQEVTLEPGQFIFGRRKAASILKMSEQTVRTCLNSLKINQQITYKSTSKYSIITIVNWEAYQSNDTEGNQQFNHHINTPLTSNQPATNQQLTTYKNVMNEKNVKKRDISGKKPPALTPLPEGFSISDRVKKWASEKGFDRLDQHLESFILKSTAKRYRYVDWDAAFMNAIRDDWAKLRNGNGHGEPRPDEFVNIFEIACLKTLEDKGEADFLDACDQRNLSPDETRGKMAAWKRQILRG
jgi:hypothetical protein